VCLLEPLFATANNADNDQQSGKHEARKLQPELRSRRLYHFARSTEGTFNLIGFFAFLTLPAPMFTIALGSALVVRISRCQTFSFSMA